MTPWLKTSLAAALVLTGLWLLAPPRTVDRREAGVEEIALVTRDGPAKEGLADAIREFERLSEERHKVDPSYPRYRVVTGQSAIRSQTEDPTRFIVSVAGGMPPDVVQFDRFAISEWAARGAFVPLDDPVARDAAAWDGWRAACATNPAALPPWPGATPERRGPQELFAIEPIRQAEYFPACWDEAVYRNPLTGEARLYGIPCDADDRALLYNKDLLIRHGFTNSVGEAQPPRTWEELETMAVAMTERDEQGRIRTIGFIPNFGNSWLYLYGWQAGGEYMSADGRTCTLNHPRVVEALEFMTRIYDQLGGVKAVNDFQSGFQSNELDPFIVGKVAMKIDGIWIMQWLAYYGRDLNLGAAPPPMPKRELDAGRAPISWVGGWAYAIPASARNKRGAWELIRFLTSRRGLQVTLTSDHYAYLSQGRPYVPRQFPHRGQNEWAFRHFIRDNPAMEPKFKDAVQVFHNLLETSRYRPVTVVGQKLWNEHIRATEAGIYHSRTPRQALDEATALVQRELDLQLHPPPGRPIRSWTWFFWLYGALLVVAVVLIYQWDTRPEWRQAIRRRLGRKVKGREEFLEGSKGSYFRAQWRDGVLCALPWIVGFVVFTGGPLLFSIVISFCRFDVLNPAVFIGGANYAWMFDGDNLFWTALYNTVFMVVGIPLGMALSLGIAMLLNLNVRGMAVWRTFFYLPSIVPAVASSILWIWIFNPQSGLLNTALASLGIQGPSWLNDKQTSKWALILMGLWGAGGGMIIWLAGLKGIAQSYYEAATIDGANKGQQFLYITLPMLTPYILFNLIMGLIGTFQIFTQAFVMTGGGPEDSTLFFAYHLFNHAFRYLHMGYAAAMAWFLFLIVVILTWVQMRLSERWVHYEEDA